MWPKVSVSVLLGTGNWGETAIVSAIALVGHLEVCALPGGLLLDLLGAIWVVKIILVRRCSGHATQRHGRESGWRGGKKERMGIGIWSPTLDI
jgi:hypothetical protein